MHEYERIPFTLMTFLGELGGAYAIISALPPLFISTIVEKLFKNQVARMMPVKRDPSVENRRHNLGLLNKFRKAEIGHARSSLSMRDVQHMLEEALRFEYLAQLSTWKLVCQKCCCRRDEQAKMQEDFYEEFESKLDVWNLV